MFVVELADGRAVRAFHVVGEDFQLRLGVDGGVGREQQSLVGLLGVGLLGVGMNEDFAVEDAVGSAVEDGLVQLVAIAVRLGVVDARVIVDELPAAGHREAVEDALAAFGAEDGVDVVADEGAAQGDAVRAEVAAAVLLDLQRGDVIGGVALALDLVMVDDGIGGRRTSR